MGKAVDDNGLTAFGQKFVQNLKQWTWLSTQFGSKADVTTVNQRLGGLTLVKCTQTEYDALATKDPNTLYVIVG